MRLFPGLFYVVCLGLLSVRLKRLGGIQYPWADELSSLLSICNEVAERKVAPAIGHACALVTEILEVSS